MADELIKEDTLVYNQLVSSSDEQQKQRQIVGTTHNNTELVGN